MLQSAQMKRVGLHPSEEGCNRLTICYCSDLFLHSSLFCLLRRAILPVRVCQRAQCPRSPLGTAMPADPSPPHSTAGSAGAWKHSDGRRALRPPSLRGRRRDPRRRPSLLGAGFAQRGDGLAPTPDEKSAALLQISTVPVPVPVPVQARPGQAQPPTGPSRQSSAQRALLLGSPRTSASTAGCGTALAVAAKGGSCPSASPSSSPCAAPPPVSC